MLFAVRVCELGLQSLLWILCILHDTLIKVLGVVEQISLVEGHTFWCQQLFKICLYS